MGLVYLTTPLAKCISVLCLGAITVMSSYFKPNFTHSLRRLFVGFLAGIFLISGSALPHNVQAQSPAPANGQEVYLPLFSNNPKLATRMGFGITWPTGGSRDDIEIFPKSAELRAGWYLNWGVHKDIPQPNGIGFAQMVRVHQSLSCTDENGTQRWWYAFRDECPYEEPVDGPSSYRYRPNQSSIEQTAAAKPGSLWLVGNEIEREDWADCWPSQAQCDIYLHKGQDEITPASYAMAYHELHGIIKAADPTAQVAIGGVIQATPLRLEYLTMVWDSYQLLYGEEMPVDVWNTHAFVFSELPAEAAGIPVGIPANAEPSYLGNDRYALHIDFSKVAEQIVGLRQWMKERGQQEKPLIISEYGLVYPNSLMGHQNSDPTPVVDFLIESSTYFLNEKNCELGYSADECRLVQQWNWFSLEGRTAAANPHARLLDPSTGELTEAGEAWRDFVEDNIAELSWP